jgi:HAE1 family hydrophobic/amphiphilic exporter-1
MAVAVIGGLVASTMLTLVVVPVVYDLVEAGLDRMFSRSEGRAPAPKGGTAATT